MVIRLRERIEGWARAVKRDLVALWLAARDPGVPWLAKALAIATVAYALSPIDLIPDFIPVLGYLDDLILVPLAVLAVVRMIPVPVMSALRAEAARRLAARLPKSWVAAVVIVGIWVALGLVLLIALAAAFDIGRDTGHGDRG